MARTRRPRSGFEKLSSGLAAPEPPQPREGRDGDPQLAALHQFLADRLSLTPEDAVADIGSGNGVLAAAMASRWSDGTAPLYIAVDLEPPLNELSLPASIHNNSFKVEFRDFFESRITDLSSKIRLVILRNIFHELDISTTGYLLAKLNSHLRPETEVYIQDMERLTRPERGNAGWDPVILGSVLTDLGFQETKPVPLRSHSGTGWFSMITKASGKVMDERAAARRCAEARAAQRAKLVIELNTKNKDYAKYPPEDVLILGQEIAQLDVQLTSFSAEITTPSNAPAISLIGGRRVPLISGGYHHVFTVASQEDLIAKESGLVAVFRNKDIVDMPQLMRGSISRIWFAGYSQKLLFTRTENVAALLSAIENRVDVRILVSAPDGPAAALRSREPAYSDETELIQNIRDTIRLAIRLFEEQPSVSEAIKAGLFDVRTMIRVPPCSFFIVDDLCYVSLYTSLLSGSAAPAFVFLTTKSDQLGYYEILAQEFIHMFNEAESIFATRQGEG